MQHKLAQGLITDSESPPIKVHALVEEGQYADSGLVGLQFRDFAKSKLTMYELRMYFCVRCWTLHYLDICYIGDKLLVTKTKTQVVSTMVPLLVVVVVQIIQITKVAAAV